MEEQIFLFPLPVEKLRTEFVWKMNSFSCCLFWRLYWGKVQRHHSVFFWLQKCPPVFLPLSYPHRQARTPMGTQDPLFALSFGTGVVRLLINVFMANGV